MLPTFLTNPDPRRYLDENYIVIDFENTTIGKGLAIYAENNIVVAGYALGPGHPALHEALGSKPIPRTQVVHGSEFSQNLVVELTRLAGFVVAHNAKFDLGWLARCGVDTSKILCYDTMLGEYVLGGNRWKLPQLSLDAIAKRRWGERKLDLIKTAFWSLGVDTGDIPAEWLERYCLRDVELTERLFREQRNDLLRSNKLHIQYLRCLVAPVLADIEFSGMRLDPALVDAAYQKAESDFAEAQKALEKFAPINWNSWQQKIKYIYGDLGFAVTEYNDSGNPSTEVDVLLALPARTKKQEEFKAIYETYAGLNSDLTKYLRKFQECCAQNKGILKAVQNQCNTQTHRLSSTGLEYKAQLHNINRGLKYMFLPLREGNLVGEADAATLEFSTAVHLGRDSQGLADLINPAFDAHTVTASVIWPDRPTKDMRQLAKPHTFKPLYYGQSGTEAEQRYYKYFRAKYKGISQWQDDNIYRVLESPSKSLVTEWGLEFFWPSTKMTRSGYIKNSTQIANYPVQSFATADIVPMALVWMWHRLKDSGSPIILMNTVHDSIVADIPVKDTEAWHDLSRTCLLYDVYKFMHDLYRIDLTVPLGCGVIVGDHWGSKNEKKYKVEDEYWMDAARAGGML